MSDVITGVGGHAPQVDPELADVELVVPDGVLDILLRELGAVALDKVKAPARKADVGLQPVEPVSQALAQLNVQVVQIWQAHMESAYALGGCRQNFVQTYGLS